MPTNANTQRHMHMAGQQMPYPQSIGYITQPPQLPGQPMVRPSTVIVYITVF